MDEDEDAFLYGDGGEAKNGHGGTLSDPAETSAQGQSAGQSDPPTVGKQASAEQDVAGNDDDEDDEEEEEDEDSDSDLEIIMDSNAADASRPPPGYNNNRPLQPFNKTLQMQQRAQQQQQQSALSSEYTPLTRPGQSPNPATASLAALTTEPTAERKPLTTQTGLSAAQAYALQQQQQNLIADLPEGPPPPAPMTAPRLDLNPSDQALMLPPDVVGGEPGPLIYHVDPQEMEEKPWRRPGADITDWFNYGFNEETWRAWGERKTNIHEEKLLMEREGLSAQTNKGKQMQNASSSSLQGGGSSNMAMGGMPSQPIQMMQAIAASSGFSMTPEQMMSFMGMSGNAMGGNAPSFGGGAGNAGGMMGMGGMFGFGGAGGMPLMRMGQSQPMNGHQQGAQNHDEAEEEEYVPRDSHQDGETDQLNSRSGATMLANAPVPMGESGYPVGAPKGPGGSRAASNDHGSGRGSMPPNVPTGPKTTSSRKYNDRDTDAGNADALDYGGNARESSNGGGGGSRGSPYPSRRSPVAARSGGWDGESPGRRSRSPAVRGNDRDHRSTRRHAYRSDEREHSGTPRSSRHYDDDEADEGGSRHYQRSSARSSGTRDRSERSERRRGTSGTSGGAPDDEDDEDRGAEDEHATAGSRSKRSSKARTDRRAGREEDTTAATASVRDEDDRSGKSRRTSRKRGAADDDDEERLLSPPRESRRRR